MKILRSIPLDLIVFLLGMGLFFWGLYQIYPPAAYIGTSVILMAITLFGGRK